jgi:uncharacterized protein YukE
MAEMGRELGGAISGLNTGAWDGQSRYRAEPMLNQVQPESRRVAEDLDTLGRNLMHVADVFEQEDYEAVQNLDQMTWNIFNVEGAKYADDRYEKLEAQSGVPNSISGAVSNAATFLGPGFVALGTEWLPKKVKVNNDHWFIGREHKLWPERRGRPRKNRKKKKLRIAAFEGSVWEKESTGSTKLGGVRLGGKAKAEALKGEVGLGVDLEGGSSMVGAYAGGTLITTGASGVIGNTDLGLGGGVDLTAGEAEAFVGFKDGRVGAKIGGSLVSAEGTVGMNVAGWNVGLAGEVGVKFELGIEAGKKTRVHLGPVSIGLNIGEALGS